MAEARDQRHRYGRHYTPREVARLLAAFAIRSADDLVFDPSCGDGRLLTEALRVKKRLSPPGLRPRLTSQVYGADLSANAIELAARTRARVGTADFFDLEPGSRLSQSVKLPGAFDAIIGNPPYIRQELMDSRDKGRIEERLELDRAKPGDVFWPRWSGRSDVYVYFFAHAAPFLKLGGRLVFLTASSWLDVGYGAALREFLLKNFRVVAVIESAVESFFQDASINTCITLLERESDAQTLDSNLIRFVRLNEPLNEIFEANQFSGSTPSPGSRRLAPRQCNGALWLATSIEHTTCSLTTNEYRIRIVEQARLIAPSGCAASAQLLLFAEAAGRVTANNGRARPSPKRVAPPGSGWGKYLRADEVFFRVIERASSRLQSLSNMASVRFGVKTGANDFFYVTDGVKRAKSKKPGTDAEKNQGNQKKDDGPGLLALRDIASLRRGITTGANDFFYLAQAGNSGTASPTPSLQTRSPNIESRFLSPVVFSLKEIPGIALDRVEGRRMLFNCSHAREELAGAAALDYIKSGERAGYDKRPTCKGREPWYSVARGMKPAPLIFPSKVGERWLVALNNAGVFEDKKLYGIFPAGGVSDFVLAALLNSTWARYYAEITCRQMTGAQAIADIDVAVAEQILLPDPRELSLAMKKNLEAALLELSRRPVYSVFEEIKRTDRRRLDALTLEAIGFSNGSEREAVLDELYEAVTELVRARLAKGRRQ